MKSDDLFEPMPEQRNALILVDLQNDFLPGGALAVPAGDEVLAVANRLQPLFELVVATRDWHPPDHMSFAASHPDRKPGEVISIDGLSQVLWPVHCVQESAGAELADSLAPLSERQQVFKGQDVHVDSYSGFFDNGHRRQTQLHSLLTSRAVTRLFLLGLATDYCVKFTALDAIGLGYEVILIEDGCRGVDLQPGDVGQAIDMMREQGVIITHSDKVASML